MQPRDARDPAGRLPDGDRVPHLPRPVAPPLTRRQWLAGWACVALALVAVVLGVLR
jgi:hypothetical protein